MRPTVVLLAMSLAVAGCTNADRDADRADTAATALESAPTASAGSQAGPLSLDVGVFPGAFHSLVQHVALEEGIFESNGLDVELINTSSGPEAIATLASGGISVMINSPGNQLLANAEGQDFVGIIGGLHKPYYTWVAQLDWPTPNAAAGYPAVVEDLEGARIGVTARGAETELFTREFLKDAGLDPDRDVSWVAVGIGTQAVSAFAAGQIDVLVAVEPSQTLLIEIDKTGTSMLDLRRGEGPARFAEWPSLAWIGRRDEIEADPERFTRFQAAIAEAYEFMTDPANKARVLEIYATVLDLDPDALSAIYDNNIETIGPTFDCGAYQSVTEFMIETEQLAEENASPCDEVMWSGASAYLIPADT